VSGKDNRGSKRPASTGEVEVETAWGQSRKEKSVPRGGCARAGAGRGPKAGGGEKKERVGGLPEGGPAQVYRTAGPYKKKKIDEPGKTHSSGILTQRDTGTARFFIKKEYSAKGTCGKPIRVLKIRQVGKQPKRPAQKKRERERGLTQGLLWLVTGGGKGPKREKKGGQ